MKLFTIAFQMFLIMIFSSLSFAQLDSVYYQGPSTGSVSNGAMQTTDNFGPTGPVNFQEPKSKNRVFDFEPLILNQDDSNLPDYVYVEDNKYLQRENAGTGQTILVKKFPGIGATNAIPPDPIMAAGPNHIIAFVNGFPSIFKIFDKDGNVLKTINSAAWWAPVSPDEYGDPQVLYDHYEGRWILQVMQINEANLTAASLISYSDDSDPLGTWYVYRLDTKLHGTVNSNTWGDYPKMGYDDEAIYINTRCFQFGGSLLYNKLRIINKDELYASNGGPLTWTDFWDIGSPSSPGLRPDVIRPTISYTPGNGGYFFWANSGGANYYILYRIFDPVTAPRLRAISVSSQFYGGAPNANQLGGGTPISAIGSWMYGAPITRDGLLYAAHSIRNSAFSGYSSSKYLIVNLTSNLITEQAELGAQGYFYLYSTLTIDQDHNIAVTFSRSADTEYIGAYYSTKHFVDPPGLSPSRPIIEGLGNYQNGNPNRWGDYLGIYLDPNNYDVWMLTEYAASTNVWGTYIGQIRMVPYSGHYTFTNASELNFGNVEVGTSSPEISLIISNYGSDDLVINNIPASTGDFNLETNLTFPVTLSTYDSLQIDFSFTPAVTGPVNLNFPVSTNDPNFTGITVTGNGYRIYPALDKTFYAGSGLQNNGNILTINPLTGNGTTVGSSLFDAVKSLAIDKTTGVIYGLVQGTGVSEIIRISAGAGDSYNLFDINISQLTSIAFDTLGVFYGINLSGSIYTIDLSDGSYDFVVDAIGSYSGIAFHPETNELWATSRALIPPNRDAVFKVNLSTGDTVIVGHTGLGKMTNDIVFDVEGNLFGVTGAENEFSDFISINTSDGTGTIIGSVGFKNILGLGYAETGVTSVDDGTNNQSIPDNFILKQNYPNPFNPETRIEFSLPVNSDIILTIYNTLGQLVTKLVDGHFNAGSHSVSWNTSNHTGSKLSSGIYFYELKAYDADGKTFQQSKKMILLK